MQPGDDVGDRDVHDGQVEQRHEEPERDHHQHRPRVRVELPHRMLPVPCACSPVLLPRDRSLGQFPRFQAAGYQMSRPPVISRPPVFPTIVDRGTDKRRASPAPQANPNPVRSAAGAAKYAPGHETQRNRSDHLRRGQRAGCGGGPQACRGRGHACRGGPQRGARQGSRRRDWRPVREDRRRRRGLGHRGRGSRRGHRGTAADRGELRRDRLGRADRGPRWHPARPRVVPEGHRHQPDRHLQPDADRGGGHRPDRAGRRGQPTWCGHQHRVRGRPGGPDRPGRLLRRPRAASSA